LLAVFLVDFLLADFLVAMGETPDK